MATGVSVLQGPVERTAVAPPMVAPAILVRMELIAGTSLALTPASVCPATMAQSVSTTTSELLPHVIIAPVRTEGPAALDVTYSPASALKPTLALSVKLSLNRKAVLEILATMGPCVPTQPLGPFALVVWGSPAPCAAGRLTTVS